MTNMTRLSDYQAPNYWLTDTYLSINLLGPLVEVSSTLTFRKNSNKSETLLELHGEALNLVGIKLNQQVLQPNEYQLDASSLSLEPTADNFCLEITNTFDAHNNKTLSGLYRSGQLYCTQCEAEGFRRITYYLDRPDVLSRFKVRITANKKECPVLLSNGNLLATGSDDELSHWQEYSDPHPKPAYLFALVAGDLLAVEDHYLTQEKILVKLKLFIEADNLSQSGYALKALKKAMHWDEQTYGLAYDLDTYNIVAVNDFNMGAMENKGLNIFNAKYILASPLTASDQDYLNIDAVVGHEYFHNWSGNRITCRDWFQLSLKEGLTVFREQSFVADITQSSASFIDNVNFLIDKQFVEDAGPLAHPVRPSEYSEINNFYTVTIYEKGAEIIRMLSLLLGDLQFKAGMHYYFKQFDGQAVTIDDFIGAFEKTAQRDLSQFKLWYELKGTPVIKVSSEYLPSKQSYLLHLTQSLPKSSSEQPMHIPLAMSLLDAHGQELPLVLAGETNSPKQRTLELSSKTKTYEFLNLDIEPTLSILRNFSAPVIIQSQQSIEDLIFHLLFDQDPYNRWQASQNLFVDWLKELCASKNLEDKRDLSEKYKLAYAAFLAKPIADLSLVCKCVSLPSLDKLTHQLMPQITIDQVLSQYQWLRTYFATSFVHVWSDWYQSQQLPKYEYSAVSMAKRQLKNLALYYLAKVDAKYLEWVYEQYAKSDNMTDTMAALSIIAQDQSSRKTKVLNEFYQKWQSEPLCINKGLGVQAQVEGEHCLAELKSLSQSPLFDSHNPNKVYALLGGLGRNYFAFHQADGAGYIFMSQMIKQIDNYNPQVAAKMAQAFSQWQKYDLERKAKMQACMEDLLSKENLSIDLKEILQKTLV